MKPGFRAAFERDPTKLESRLSEIVELSNAEREALGFLSNGAYRDAIAQKRLFAIVAEEGGHSALVGYILHGGIFPHARIQQVCVSPSWRRRKIASALIDALISDLERAGYLTVKAKVADDLTHAQAFYKRHGFEAVLSTPGGSARGRTIVVRVRNLATPHLFSSSPDIDLGIPQKFGAEAAFYTFDLNVLFDLVRDRNRHDAACKLFGAALDHRIRLGIASEFVNELRRSSGNVYNDPLLQMALQLPRLPPPVDTEVLERLAIDIHDIVFTSKGKAAAGSVQAHSDARHIAQSALSRVSAFITSDRALLEARDELLTRFGIDVAGLDELIGLLLDGESAASSQNRRGEGFECSTPNVEQATSYLKGAGIRESIIDEFLTDKSGRVRSWRSAIWENGSIVALACLLFPLSTAGEHKLLINVDAGHLDREMYAEHLLDVAIKQACQSNPAAMRLLHVPGQSTVNALASARGFVAGPTGEGSVKVAIGGPIRRSNWDALRHTTRRKTSLELPADWPDRKQGGLSVEVKTRSGLTLNLPPERFEDMFGPALYLWPGRQAVIVPIQRAYADELLGTNMQPRLSFVEHRDVSFLSRRVYVNTPRARHALLPGLPIIFYESGKGGGRSAIVAIGRIVDSVLVPKEAASADARRRAVVDDLSEFSAADDVLMTTFDNLIVCPTPVPFAALKALGATGATNLISATRVSHENLVRIVEAAWHK